MNKYENLTDNFSYKEFFSGDRKLGKNSIEPPEQYFEYIMACAMQLQYVRDIIKKPIIITSGYRTKEWNKVCGGSASSYHLQGLAADSRAVGLPLFLYFSHLLKYTSFNGFGYYRWKNFVHCDLRNHRDFTIFKY
ncbi:unnamed protein product [marine sediment metagenome]|uniref:Peptidase M15A C-terminal domain-containing protein n=1 Tax=marine sediment metagenome TaxID=412755 RepID=X1S183_9ZZZZ